MARGTALRIALVACASLIASAAGTVGATVAVAATNAPALTVLNSLPVSTESRSGYSRDLFRLWTTDPATGCDTRQAVLIAERASGTVRGCSVLDGTWVSKYDGVTTTNPSAFDIDHVVPLAEAWDSGAWRWTPATRQAYANDLGFSGTLLAVSASSNRSKGDQDPAEWLPSRARCWYAKDWIAVKSRWRLSVDSSEKSALTRVLARCSPMMSVPTVASIATDATASRPSGSGSSGTSSSGTSSSGTSSSGASPTKPDPRFGTCGEAIAAGYGPYTSGRDPEYAWYIDRDGDGVACER